MNSKLSMGLKFIFLLAVALGLLVFAFRGISTRKIMQEMLQANMFWVVASLIPSVLLVAFFVARYFRNKSIKENKESKIVQLLRGLVSGVKSIANLKRPWLFVFHSVLIWFLYFLSMYLCFSSMPSTTGLGLTAALFLLVAGGLGMSAPVQGGIGAYHLLVSQGLMLYGLSKQDGLAFATLVHSSQLLMIVLFGSASILLLFQGNKNKIK